MTSIERELSRLEAISRLLDPVPEVRERQDRPVFDYAQQFLEQLSEQKVYRGGAGGQRLAAMQPREEPYAIEQLLEALSEDVDSYGINAASGGAMGYIPGGGQYYAALGDYLADVTNRYVGVSYAAPGAVQLEKSLIHWMCGLLGYPAGSAGDLTSGGSIANLVAVVTARDATGIASANVSRSPVYMTAQAHHCLHKALRIAGLGECPLRLVAMDACFRMDADALRFVIDADRKLGMKPWLVVASAGTTDTGAVDPLAAIADIAAANEMWFHVDAAYGGFFRLATQAHGVLNGIERSDSAVIDPHKGLFLPYGSGAVLVKDASALFRAHYQDANYMQDARVDEAELSPADLSPELSRPFRGLRMWLPLMLCGMAPFRAALDEKLLLARYFYQRLSCERGWELGPEPELSVVIYRYLPERGDANEFNRRLLEAIHADGRVFVSSTNIDDRFVLRLAVLHFRTHRQHVDLLLELLLHHAARLSQA